MSQEKTEHLRTGANQAVPKPSFSAAAGVKGCYTKHPQPCTDGIFNFPAPPPSVPALTVRASGALESEPAEGLPEPILAAKAMKNLGKKSTSWYWEGGAC